MAAIHRLNDILLTYGEEFSMKAYRLLPVTALALFAGCSGDSVSKMVTPDPHAAIRWMNAVPDTMAMDYRIVDIVTNASAANVAFRTASGAYRSLLPGKHEIRVFQTGSNTAACNGPEVVSKILLDTTLTFEANHYYTILHAGYMKAGASPQHRLIVSDDVFPTPASGGIAVRAINANPGASDVYVMAATATGGALSGTASFTNLAFGATSSYSSFAATASTPAASTYRVAATAAGTPTPLLGDGLLDVGDPAYVGSTTVPPLDAIGGSQQAGSVMTAVATPPQGTYTLTSDGADASCKPLGVKTVVSPGAAGAVFSVVDKNPADKVLGQ